MPIKIPSNLPANDILKDENIFCITEKRALKQDIRPLRIALLNIMPTKIVTETQLIRLLGNTPLQVEIDFLRTSTHTSKNTSEEHINSFYKKNGQKMQKTERTEQNTNKKQHKVCRKALFLSFFYIFWCKSTIKGTQKRKNKEHLC